MFVPMHTKTLLYFIGAFLWVILCGRFSIAISPAALKKRFNAELDKPLQPRYNAAPGQNLPVILNRSPNKIQLCRWGFIPHWAKDASMDYRLINARAETIIENRIFRSAFRKQRCLVLADGFYEWQKTPLRKIPHRIVLQDESPFAFEASGLDRRTKMSTGSIHFPLSPRRLIPWWQKSMIGCR